MALVTCPECKKQVSSQACSCPNCGFPLSSPNPEILSDTSASKQTEPSSGKRALIKGIIFSAIALFISANIIIYLSMLYREQEQKAYKEQLLQESIAESQSIEQSIINEAMSEIERIEQEIALQESLAEEEKLRARKEYIANLNTFKENIGIGSTAAAYVCYTTKLVWSDTIYERYNEETVAYTQTNGKFNEDFNVSLTRLYDSKDIKDHLSLINANRKATLAAYQALMNPPPEFANAFAAVEDVYSVYLDITRLAMSPSGSLNSYTEEYMTYYNLSFEVMDRLMPLIPDE